MIAMLWTAWILLIAFLLILIVSWKLCSLAVRPKTWDYQATYEEEIRKGAINQEKFEKEYQPEDFFVQSADGCSIHGIAIPAKPGTAFADGRQRVAVIAHGYSYTLLGSVKYAEIFRNLGFSCVLFDERGHGRSSSVPTTMGFREAQDIAAVCAWARKRFGEDCMLGTHGESMGAAAVMMHAPTDPQLAFAIEDCGYSDLSRELFYQMHAQYHLPRWPFLPLASLLAVVRGGVRFDTVRPAEAVGQCPPQLPFLFIHGTADTFVPSAMAHENYEAKKGIRSLQLFEGSEHARSWFDHPVQYAQVLEEFLRGNHII